MNNSDFTNNTIEAVVRIGLLLLLATWCFKIITPFIVPVVWGVVISVAIYPLFIKLRSSLGERNKLAAIIYTIIALALLITPTVMISDSLIETSGKITEQYEAGTLEIPPPNESVKEWPVVGEKVYPVWLQASVSIEDTLKKYEAESRKAAKAIIAGAAGAAGTILQFVLSIIISGILVANASGAHEMTVKLFTRLTSEASGKAYADLSKATIRSVAQGVLGVAIIQAVLSAVGMMVMDVPAWGLWTLFILVLAIAQLPPIIVLGFVSAYVFSVAEATPAVIFLIYCLIISASDGFLKPLFLGRGMETPMLVILLGAIGGMMMSGIIGLFVGAIILALGYELFMVWLTKTEAASQ
ncbi:MAG: AI-2E family transporter [Gammaproteobacteria bacterium]|nr:AI-2E family transporter [Gammaproteobacteria bacterium]MBT8133195.1 AI-2E family transporter [Gammaproteobacteria bacterium]NNJ50683.1 AI-2E family transporter [Gammaproteobacteria bacterium]